MEGPRCSFRWTVATLGWCTLAAARASRRKRLRAEAFPMNCELMILRATVHRRVGIDGFVGYAHATMSELERLSILISQNPVMSEMELGRDIRNGIALGFGSS